MKDSGNPGAGGEYSLIGETKAQRLEARSAKWNVPPEYREAVRNSQLKIAIDENQKPRDRTRAAQFILACDKLDKDTPSVAIQQNFGVTQHDLVREVLDQVGSDPRWLEYARQSSRAGDTMQLDERDIQRQVDCG